MTNENTIRKATQIISVAALTIIASGCATQAGGSKLDQVDANAEATLNKDDVILCAQFGAKKECYIEDRLRAEEDWAYRQDSLRQNQDF